MSTAAILNFCIFRKILDSVPKNHSALMRNLLYIKKQTRTLSFPDHRMLFCKLWNSSPKHYHQRAGRNSWTIPIPTWPFPFHYLQPGLLQVLSKGNIRLWLNVPCPLSSAEWLGSCEQRKIRKITSIPWCHSARVYGWWLWLNGWSRVLLHCVANFWLWWSGWLKDSLLCAANFFIAGM